MRNLNLKIRAISINFLPILWLKNIFHYHIKIMDKLNDQVPRIQFYLTCTQMLNLYIFEICSVKRKIEDIPYIIMRHGFVHLKALYQCRPFIHVYYAENFSADRYSDKMRTLNLPKQCVIGVEIFFC
jgi:hypothetical protein